MVRYTSHSGEQDYQDLVESGYNLQGCTELGILVRLGKLEKFTEELAKKLEGVMLKQTRGVWRA